MSGLMSMLTMPRSGSIISREMPSTASANASTASGGSPRTPFNSGAMRNFDNA